MPYPLGKMESRDLWFGIVSPNQGGLQATSHGIRAWEQLLEIFPLPYAINDDLSRYILTK